MFLFFKKIKIKTTEIVETTSKVKLNIYQLLWASYLALTKMKKKIYEILRKDKTITQQCMRFNIPKMFVIYFIKKKCTIEILNKYSTEAFILKYVLVVKKFIFLPFTLL